MLLLSGLKITKWGIRYKTCKAIEQNFDSDYQSKTGNSNLCPGCMWYHTSHFHYHSSGFFLNYYSISKYGQSLYSSFYLKTLFDINSFSHSVLLFMIHFLKWVVFLFSLLPHRLLISWLIHFNLPSVLFALVRLSSLWSVRFPSGKIQGFLFSLPLFFVLSASSGTVGDRIKLKRG